MYLVSDKEAIPFFNSIVNWANSSSSSSTGTWPFSSKVFWKYSKRSHKCPCRLGTGSLSSALSNMRDRFWACFIEGKALDMDTDPAFFEAVFRLSNNESNKNSNSGLVSEKNVCICTDKFCNWLMITLAPIGCRSVVPRNSLTLNSKNRTVFVVCRNTFLG